MHYRRETITGKHCDEMNAQARRLNQTTNTHKKQ